MTAEVAILNKTVAASAADSAITISAGSAQQKIFDSADKLFELSRCFDLTFRRHTLLPLDDCRYALQPI